jgi:glycosyltransferase involved in cell wall biosynthesis
VNGRPVASVIIPNYNYARFLPAAIDSALRQTYRPLEVIVVDDGSTDGSHEIIAQYGKAISAIFKPNRGQDSAINAGFAASHGDVVCFLDADDLLEPGAMTSAVAEFERDADVVKVHWPLWMIDLHGRRTGAVVPASTLPEGVLLEAVASAGPGAYTTPPTSGNAWARRLLERVLPIPEANIRSGSADMFLSAVAPLYGRVGRLATPHGAYRAHGGNGYLGRQLDRLPLMVAAWEQQAAILASRLAERGIPVDPSAWRRGSWLHRLERATSQLSRLLPPAAPFILVDEEQWGMPDVLFGRRRLPFLERDGVWWGPPPDDVTAMRELERLRAAGVAAIVFAWPAFWWLAHYAGFHGHLKAKFRCLLENEELVVFALDDVGG